MKRFQKLATILLALVMLLTVFTACGDKGPKPRSAGEVGKEVVSMLETDLSETEMRAAIDGYAASLTEALAAGSAEAKFVDEKGGAVALVVTQEGIEKPQELMKFGSVKEAFAYFVYTGQIDNDGKLVNPPVVQTVPGNNATSSEAATSDVTTSDTAQNDAASTDTSEVSAESAAQSDVSETATEAPADNSIVMPFADSASPAA